MSVSFGSANDPTDRYRRVTQAVNVKHGTSVIWWIVSPNKRWQSHGVCPLLAPIPRWTRGLKTVMYTVPIEILGPHQPQHLHHAYRHSFSLLILHTKKKIGHFHHGTYRQDHWLSILHHYIHDNSGSCGIQDTRRRTSWYRRGNQFRFLSINDVFWIYGTNNFMKVLVLTLGLFHWNWNGGVWW